MQAKEFTWGTESMSEKKIVSADRRYPVLSAPGLILAGPSPQQIVYNQEAIRILAYPNPPTAVKRIGTLVNEKMDGLLVKQRSNNGADDDVAIIDFTSGRRHYLCTRYVLNLQGLQGARTVVILFERRGSLETTIQELCNGWRLTEREREAVGFLTRGLTSKEIAQHMGISPNTVKSFLRLVMSKAGVSTRTGLIGRVAGIVPRPRAMAAATGQSGNREYPNSARLPLRAG